MSNIHYDLKQNGYNKQKRFIYELNNPSNKIN